MNITIVSGYNICDFFCDIHIGGRVKCIYKVSGENTLMFKRNPTIRLRIKNYKNINCGINPDNFCLPQNIYSSYLYLAIFNIIIRYDFFFFCEGLYKPNTKIHYFAFSASIVLYLKLQI